MGTTTQLLTNKYRLQNAQAFVNSASSGYYVFAGQSGAWANGVPTLYDNPNTTEFTTYNTMLFGKALNSSDVSLMINGVAWGSGSVYAMYDDQDTNLINKSFYVYTSIGTPATYYYVWKCLYNNNGVASTAQPLYSDTIAGDPYYETSDGYQWKYMYKFPASLYNTFTTAGYIPVLPDANVTSNAVSGAIDVIVPVDGNNNITATTGSGYNNYYSNTFSASSVTNTTYPLIVLPPDASKINEYYNGCYLYVTSGTGAGQYKQVTSHYSNTSGTYLTLASQFAAAPTNGSQYLIAPAVTILNSSDANTSAAAIALVNSAAGNSIYQIQVLNRGTGVYAAGAYINASPAVGISNTATIRVIAGPEGGHGSNVAAELFCNTVGLSITFANSESNTIPTVSDYQSIGIIRNPLFSNVTFTVTGNTGIFSVGETVTQTIGNTVSTGIVTDVSPLEITNASSTWAVSTNGSFGLIHGTTSNVYAQITAFTISGKTKPFTTFTQFYQYNGYYTTSTFSSGQSVYQGNPTVNSIANSTSQLVANAIYYAGNTTSVYVTDKFGPIYSGNTINSFSVSANGTVISQDTQSFTINTITPPDLVPESGDVLYIENFTGINRANTQSETIQLILNY